MGLAIGVPFIVMLIAVGIFVGCRKCSMCTPKGKRQEKYQISRQYDGSASPIDASSKPLSTLIWLDSSEIKICITSDENDEIDLGSKSDI